MLGILGIHYDRWLPNSKNLHWEVAYLSKGEGKGREGKGQMQKKGKKGREGGREAKGELTRSCSGNCGVVRYT